MQLISLIRQHWIAITLLVLAAITFVSLRPLDQLPPIPGSDKAHHLISYALLMFPTALRRPNYWLLIGALFIGWGGAIELLQPYVNRYGEWLDFAANSVGVLLGALLAQLVAVFSAAEKRF
ncbi:MAG: hypothetical protein MI754_08040 [Chromatiales bacterium]|nr:hypothetical protein [Chromatiales bacterium]